MKTPRIFLLAVLLGAALAARAADAAASRPLPDFTRPKNAADLLNGRDLTGWRLFLADPKVDPAVNKSEPSAATVTPDGVLHFSSKLSGYLISDKNRSDYHLHVEWRWPTNAATNANSGVLVHLNAPDVVWPVCLECQLKTGNAGQIVGMGNVDIPAAPMLTGRKRANKFVASTEKPLGQWNNYDIFCRGDTIEVFINGTRKNFVEKISVHSGSVALQLEGFPIDFRNVWLASL